MMQNMKGKSEKIIRKVLLGISDQVIRRDIGTTCPWFTYQPKAPESVLQMRKDNEEKF